MKLDPDNDKQVSGDIKLFISTKVDELSSMIGFSDEFRRAVEDALVKRAEGTFLWVGFAMTELLRKRTCSEVLETIRALPRGLPATYSQMLLQIEPNYRKTTSLILRWVTMAVRPLSLGELAAAIGTQSSALISTEEAVRDQVTMCGALLRTQEQEVGLVHQSAKDYLLDQEADSNAVLKEVSYEPGGSSFSNRTNLPGLHWP